jgi:AraC family transcriptional regulator
MKMPSWPILIGGAILVLVGVVLSIMTRLGSFKPVAIERVPRTGPMWLLSKNHLGAYHKIAPMISEIETWARANGEPCALTFGEYTDNPEQTDEDRLRSRGGCIISDEAHAIKLQALALPAGVSVTSYEIPDALTASFDGSPSIGPVKVYPQVFSYMASLDLQSSGPIFEIYEVVSPTAGRTRYIFPVESTRRAPRQSPRPATSTGAPVTPDEMPSASPSAPVK